MDGQRRYLVLLLLLAGCGVVTSTAALVMSRGGKSAALPPGHSNARTAADDARARALDLARRVVDRCRTDEEIPDDLMEQLSLMGPEALPAVMFLLSQDPHHDGYAVSAGVGLFTVLEAGMSWSTFYYGHESYAFRPIPGGAAVVSEFIESDVDFVRSRMILCVHRYFKEPTLLLAATHDADPYIRSEAFEALGEHFPWEPEDFKEIAIGLKDPEPMVRAAAAAAIGNKSRPDFAEPLLSLLDDTAEVERVYGIDSGFVSVCGAPARDDRKPTVRDVAVWAVQQSRRKFYGFVSLAETTEDMDVIVARIRADDFVPAPLP